jgi:hypothetical protein
MGSFSPFRFLNKPATDIRRFDRVTLKKRASLVINPGRYEDFGRREERISSVILDSSRRGFRVKASVALRRGHFVELIPDDEPWLRCQVIWVGRAGSGREGEAGLQIV